MILYLKLLDKKIGHNDLLGISEYTTPTEKNAKYIAENILKANMLNLLYK